LFLLFQRLLLVSKTPYRSTCSRTSNGSNMRELDNMFIYLFSSYVLLNKFIVLFTFFISIFLLFSLSFDVLVICTSIKESLKYINSCKFWTKMLLLFMFFGYCIKLPYDSLFISIALIIELLQFHMRFFELFPCWI